MKYFFTSQISENIKETPEGYLLCLDVPIARTGEMTYGPGESPIEVGPDGIAIVSRDAKEVFRPETIASFHGKPFTIKHPEDFVNPSNFSVLAKGSVLNPRIGTGEHADHMIGDILITEAEAIKLVKGGVREVSAGYECEYIQTGIGRGYQSNIIGNHVALVEKGRAETAFINDQKGAKMSKLKEKINSIFAKAGDEAAKVVDESGGKEDKSDDTPMWANKMMKTMEKVADAMTQVAQGSQPSKMADEDKEDDKGKEKKDDDKAKDEGGEESSRLDKLEASVAAILEKLSGGSDADEDDKDESKDGEGEESEDAEGEESEDDDFEETPAGQDKAHDEASRIEILAPGAKFAGKDAKRKALMKAYEAKDSKQIIMNFNRGKDIDLKKASQKTIDHLFVGASEIVGIYRTKEFSKWKQVRDNAATDEFGASTGKSPDQINEINAKFYKGAQ